MLKNVIYFQSILSGAFVQNAFVSRFLHKAGMRKGMIIDLATFKKLSNLKIVLFASGALSLNFDATFKGKEVLLFLRQ